MAVSEYDAFGPWIYEIDEEHPMPKLFVPHIPQDEAALMLFKIPRNIERRLATPDMDLYDYIIGAYSNHICILKREERTVAKKPCLKKVRTARNNCWLFPLQIIHFLSKLKRKTTVFVLCMQL